MFELRFGKLYVSAKGGGGSGVADNESDSGCSGLEVFRAG